MPQSPDPGWAPAARQRCTRGAKLRFSSCTVPALAATAPRRRRWARSTASHHGCSTSWTATAAPAWCWSASTDPTCWRCCSVSLGGYGCDNLVHRTVGRGERAGQAEGAAAGRHRGCGRSGPDGDLEARRSRAL